MTARWVVDDIADQRDLEISWRPISLLLKNQPSPDSDYYAPSKATHDFLRVMEAVRAADGEAPIQGLYWALATRVHHDKTLDVDVAALLSELGLDPAHAAAADDESWDAVIQTAMDEGLALTGGDVGTPLLAFDGANGERVGIFGPVISREFRADRSLAIWDAMVTLAETPGFWELKRTRTEGPQFPARP